MVLDNFRAIELIWDRANKSIIKTIKTASSDTTGRYLSVKVLDGGQEVTLNNAKLQLYWEHPNFNTSGTDDFNTVKNGGLFKMTFSKEMLTNIGELNAHLVLTLPDGKITSDAFEIEVIKGASSGVVIPANGESAAIKAVYDAMEKLNNFDGGPSIFMNTLTELKTTYPKGAAGVALVRETDPAKIYVWNGTAWEDFGDYQGIEIKDDTITANKIIDGEITPEKTNFIKKSSVNLFDSSKVLYNKKIGGNGVIGDDTTNLSDVLTDVEVISSESYITNFFGRVTFKRSDGTIISTTLVYARKPFVTPTGTGKIDISMPKDDSGYPGLDNIIINRGTVLTKDKLFALSKDYLNLTTVEDVDFLDSVKNIYTSYPIAKGTKIIGTGQHYYDPNDTSQDSILKVPSKENQSYIANNTVRYSFRNELDAVIKVILAEPFQVVKSPANTAYVYIGIVKVYQGRVYVGDENVKINEGTFIPTEYGYTHTGNLDKEDEPVYQFSKLPINAKGTYQYNGVSFTQDNITYYQGLQFAVWWDTKGHPIIAKRLFGSENWQTYDLFNVAGNPLHAPVANDGHNNIVVAVSEDGHIHVMGNHHDTPLKYVKTSSPLDITTFVDASDSLTSAFGAKPSTTYPRFVKGKTGTLFLFLRQGYSGNGSVNMFKYSAGAWSLVQRAFLNGQLDNVSPYLTHIAVDKAGTIHIGGTWRTDSTANSNASVFYVKSEDEGVTWKKSTGETYALPIRKGFAEEALHTEDTGSGIINQFGLEVDDDLNPHIAYFRKDENGYTNIYHIYNDGDKWVEQKITNFKKELDYSGTLWRAEITRPSLFTFKNRVYIMYSVLYSDKKNSLRLVECTNGKPIKDVPIIDFNLNNYEPTFDTQLLYQRGKLSMLVSANAIENAEYKDVPIYAYTINLDKIDQFLNRETQIPRIETLYSTNKSFESVEPSKVYDGVNLLPILENGGELFVKHVLHLENTGDLNLDSAIGVGDDKVGSLTTTALGTYETDWFTAKDKDAVTVSFATKAGTGTADITSILVLGKLKY